MHRVEVPPFSTPNEIVSFEDVHDLKRDTVSVVTILGPKPIVGELGIDIDGYAPRMPTAIPGVLDHTAIERASTRKGIFLYLWGESIEFLGHGAKFVRNAVHCRDR